MKYINLIVAFLMGIPFALAVSHTSQASLRRWLRPKIKTNSEAQAPSVVKDTIQGPEGNYTLTDIKWEVPIGADRTETITGTIQDVIRHLEVVAPEILEANNISTTTADPSTDSPAPFDGTLSAKIARPDNVDCNAMATVAKSKRIMDGVRYLHGVSGKPKNDPVSPPTNTDDSGLCCQGCLANRPQEILRPGELLLRRGHRMVQRRKSPNYP